MKKELLNEQNYQNVKGKISKVAVIVLVVGVLLGISLILTGIVKNSSASSRFSEENKAAVASDIEKERQKLQSVKEDLINEGVKESRDYDDGKAYDLYIIKNVLDPSFSHCLFDEYKNNPITSKYCSLKLEYEEINSSVKKSFATSGSIPLFIFGAFSIIASCMIAGSIYLTSRQREIMAYQMQGIMPLATEGLEKIAPTVSKVGKKMTEEMAPAYGKLAKEISKGIKEGLKDEENDK